MYNMQRISKWVMFVKKKNPARCVCVCHVLKLQQQLDTGCEGALHIHITGTIVM